MSLIYRGKNGRFISRSTYLMREARVMARRRAESMRMAEAYEKWYQKELLRRQAVALIQIVAIVVASIVLIKMILK